MSASDPVSIISDSFKKIWRRIRILATETLSIRDVTDTEGTVEGIRKDIFFKGHTAWILVLSILIASIGLNVNSVAVIIGAMLISPLMGPIVGVGLAFGINDWDMLFKSLKNLTIAVALALITSATYFALSPLDFEQSELLSRTRPTLLDVLIALFGGLAGIVAGSRKEKTNVIPGVAIATALMPPLCTAGFGIAHLKANFFMGAFYLFFINSVFIALSTYLVVRYLKFPKVQQLEAGRLKRYRLGIYFFLLLTVLPSVMIFWSVIQETRFSISAERLIAENTKFEGSELISKKITYSDTVSIIELYYIGAPVDLEKQLYLESKLEDYKISGKEKFATTGMTRIVIHQDGTDEIELKKEMETMSSKMRVNLLEDIYKKNEELVRDKEERIKILEQQILKMRAIDFKAAQLEKELKFHFSTVNKFSYANLIEVTGSEENLKTDTIPSILVNFTGKLDSRRKKAEIEKIEEWLRIRFEKDKVQVLEY